MRFTADDVARLAGVSVSTVSRVINTPEKVSPRTRQRVQQLAQELSYHPSRAARGLARGRTETLGLVIPDLENPFFSALTKALHARAQAAGYQLFVTDTDEDPGQELELLSKLSRDVDGIVLCSARADDDDLRAAAGGSRVVTLHREVPGWPSIRADAAAAMGQVVRHLVAWGHREIAYVGGPPTSYSDRQRRAAFLQLTSDIDGVTGHLLGHFQPFFSGGVVAADLILDTPVTAVVAFNDLIALGVLDRVRSAGIQVPEQLSITSFDNTMLATAVTPHLTSVDHPNRLVARHCLDILLTPEDADPDRAVSRQVLFTQLIVRASSGPAPQK